MAAMRVASNEEDKGVGRATTRVMAVVMTVAGDDEGNCNGDEGGK